jgi:hypothetical protein
LSRGLIHEFGKPMKRIASLSILFPASSSRFERARFDLWILTAVTIVTLLWNLVRRSLRPRVDLQRHDPYERLSSRGEGDYADKLLSAMRFEFGGHLEEPKSEAA